jgi:hypothetical protein
VSWHPTLGSIERRTDLPQDRPRPLTDAQWAAGRLGVIGGGSCWCGDVWPHDWPGKADGEPHPRHAEPVRS